ncbi:MAG: hypothetical protein ABL921_25535 [Pirellula sp.]
MNGRHRQWPIAVLILGMVMINLTFFQAFRFLSASQLLLAVIVGIAFAQIILFASIAACVGRSWLVGISLSTILVCLSLGAVTLGQQLAYGMMLFQDPIFLSGLWAVLAIPVCMVGASAPLVGMRLLAGWRLAREPFTATRRGAIGLEEMFLVTTTIAALLIMTQVPAIFWDVPPLMLLLTLGLVCTFLVVLNLLVTLPAVYLLYRVQSRMRGLAISFVLALGTGTAIAWMTGTMGFNSAMDPGQWSIVLCGSVSGWVTSILAHACIGLSGYRLIGYAKESPVEDEASEYERKLDRTWHRRLTAMIVLMAMISGFAGMLSQDGRFRSDQELSSLSQELKTSGGSIDVNNEGLYKASLGKYTTDETLATLDRLYGVKELSLAETQITNAGLVHLKKFPNLESIDLTLCKIDDAGLKELQSLMLQWPKFRHLSLSSTGVTREGILALLVRPLQSLDVSNLGLNDEDAAAIIDNHGISALVFSGNKLITDRVLLKVMKSRLTRDLDLSGTSVDGSGFKKQLTLSNLKLHNVPLTDAAFGPNLANLTIHRTLSLSNTQLTKSILPMFANCTSIRGYEFGEGSIVEADLSALGNGISRLSLTSKQFTGRCFEYWQPSLYYLSLRGAGLTDATIPSVAKLTRLSYLDVSDTAITDACLPSLAKMNLAFMNISNTQITADGLLANAKVSELRLVVAIGQYTPEDLRRLRQKFQVIVGKPEDEW